MHQGAVCEEKAEPRGLWVHLCVSQSPVASSLGTSAIAAPHRAEARVISVGSLQGWGRTWPGPAGHTGGGPGRSHLQK